MVEYGLRMPSGAFGFGSNVSSCESPPLTSIQIRFLTRSGPFPAIGPLACSELARPLPTAAQPIRKARRRVMLSSIVKPLSQSEIGGSEWKEFDFLTPRTDRQA